jgi:hypothetical protein
MKRLAYVFILVALPVIGMSQQYQLLPNFYRPLDPSEIRQSNKTAGDKLDFDMTVGTGFSSFAGQSAMNTYIAPSIGYQVNSDLSLRFTGIFSNTSGMPFANASAGSPQGAFAPANPSNNAFTISGQGLYQPNDRLYITAGGQYTQNSMAPFRLYPEGNDAFSNDYKSINFGMGYKISEDASISFQMRFSDGYDPFANPYNRNRYHSSPFYQPYPW